MFITTIKWNLATSFASRELVEPTSNERPKKIVKLEKPMRYKRSWENRVISQKQYQKKIFIKKHGSKIDEATKPQIHLMMFSESVTGVFFLLAFMWEEPITSANMMMMMMLSSSKAARWGGGRRFEIIETNVTPQPYHPNKRCRESIRYRGGISIMPDNERIQCIAHW